MVQACWRYLVSFVKQSRPAVRAAAAAALLLIAIGALVLSPWVRGLLIGAAGGLAGKTPDPRYWHQWLLTRGFLCGFLGIVTALCLLYRGCAPRMSAAAAQARPWLTAGQFLILAAGAASLRFLVMTLGHNYDFDSWCIVGDIAANGGNVYAQTSRYNYGPPFSLILGLFSWIASSCADPRLVFRILLVGLLTLADIALGFLVLKRSGSMAAAALLLLNPVGVVITGHHNQFDVLAILCAFLGCLMVDENEKAVTRRDIPPLLLLTLSLSLKHLVFILPAWMLVHRGLGLRRRILYAVLPPALFLLLFLPWLGEGGAAGIARNVFLYRSYSTFPLLHPLLADLRLDRYYVAGFIGLMCLLGLATGRMPLKQRILFYFAGLCAFSSATASHYPAIAVFALCLLSLPGATLYTAVAGFFLVIHPDGLGLVRLFPGGAAETFVLRTGNTIAAWLLLLIVLYKLPRVAQAGAPYSSSTT